MRAPFEHHDPAPDEGEIRSLSDQRGLPPVQVRRLFRRELARLGMGAKVGSYLAVLTASNVRGMLRRKAELAGAAQLMQERNAAWTTREQRHLQRWEDDGGRLHRAP